MKKHLLIISLLGVLALALVVACTHSEGPASSSASVPKMSSVQDTKAKAEPEVEEKPLLPTEPYYVLIIGNDSRNNTVDSKGNDDPGRADTTMVARIDPKTYQVSLLTIPRDTPISTEEGTWKINREYTWYGAEGYKETIEKFTGLKMSYYLDLGMPEYVDFFNAIDGVDAYVPADMTLKDITTGDKISLSAGDQHLNGNEALVLSRVRKIFYWGDPIRQYSSRHIIETVITNNANDSELAEKTLDTFFEYVKTDWPKEEMTLQVLDFCLHADQVSFVEGNGPYDGAWRDDLNNWFCYEDPDTWNAIIEVFRDGGDPTTVFSLPPLQ